MTYKLEFRRFHVRVRAWQHYDNAATCAIIPNDNGRVADCIERADHFWTLRSDEDCLAFDNFDNNYCRSTCSCVCCLFFIASPTTLTYSFFSTKLSSLIEFPISCSSKYDAGPLRLIVFEVVRVRKLVDCNKNAVGLPYPVSFMVVVGEAGWPRS